LDISAKSILRNCVIIVRKAGVSRMGVVCRPSEARVTNHA